MRGVSKRLARIVCIVALLAVLGGGTASAAPGDDGDIGFRNIVTRAKHLIVKILDELGLPKP